MKSRRFDLQRFRAEQKITQQKLSELTGFPQSFISQIERGKVSCPMSFIETLGKLFNKGDMDTYVEYIDISKPQQPDEHRANRSNKNNPATVAEQTPTAQPTVEQQTINRLVELLNRSERRNEKLEAEVERLSAELATLKGTRNLQAFDPKT